MQIEDYTKQGVRKSQCKSDPLNSMLLLLKMQQQKLVSDFFQSLTTGKSLFGE